jgi:hypothetical protein
MTAISRTLLVLVVAAGDEAPTAQSRSSKICSGADSNVRCLAKNLDALYAQDYERFWRILHESAPKPELCVPDKKTIDFLSLARVKTTNAEFSEFFAECVETLCVKAPDCFRKASAQLDPEARKRLRQGFETPVFLDREELARARCLGDPPGQPRKD